jgi:hypothetical protein
MAELPKELIFGEVGLFGYRIFNLPVSEAKFDDSGCFAMPLV